MTECQFIYDDAAYVLGALPPEDRRVYESHLAGCPACRASIREVAGLPGLLSRLSPEDLVDVEPAPPTLLPRLLASAKVDRRRGVRRMRWLAAAACLALLLAVAVPVGWFALRDQSPAAKPPAASAQTTVTLQPVQRGFLPVTASVGLTQVLWGTKVHLACSYGHSSYQVKRWYTLVAVAQDGRVDSLGSWTVGPDDDAELDAATRFTVAELAAFEIRTSTGRTILRAVI